MFRDFWGFYPGSGNKRTNIYLPDSQCVSETLFFFKTTKHFNLKNTHKEGKKTPVVIQEKFNPIFDPSNSQFLLQY